MLSADLYRSLFVALHKRDAGEIAKTAYECLNMPIVVTDAAFVVIAKYPDSNFGDEQWDANRVGEQIEPRFLETFR